MPVRIVSNCEQLGNATSNRQAGKCSMSMLPAAIGPSWPLRTMGGQKLLRLRDPENSKAGKRGLRARVDRQSVAPCRINRVLPVEWIARWRVRKHVETASLQSAE